MTSIRCVVIILKTVLKNLEAARIRHCSVQDSGFSVFSVITKPTTCRVQRDSLKGSCSAPLQSLLDSSTLITAFIFFTEFYKSAYSFLFKST